MEFNSRQTGVVLGSHGCLKPVFRPVFCFCKSSLIFAKIDVSLWSGMTLLHPRLHIVIVLQGGEEQFPSQVPGSVCF